MWKKIKSYLMKLGLAAAFTAYLSGCMLAPEGVKVKCEADGVISPQEEVKLIEKVESGRMGEFEGLVQMAVNDIDQYSKKKIASMGLELSGIDSKSHLYMTKNREETKRKYKEMYFRDMPDHGDAFYGPNNTIYIPKEVINHKGLLVPIFLERFFKHFEHEKGHHMRYGIQEFSSLGYEYYFYLKFYEMNRKLGLRFLEKAICYSHHEKAGEFSDGSLHYYRLGCINLIFQANKEEFNGNLERALDNILMMPQYHMEKELVNYLNKEYPDSRTAYLSELEKLVTKEGFRDSFNELNDAEFFGMADFLKAYANYHTLLADRPGGINIEDIANKTKGLFRAFLDEHGNLFMRAKVTRALTYLYDTDKNDIWDPLVEELNSAEINWEKAEPLLLSLYNICSKVIEINKPYPCEYDFAECPSFAVTLLPEHIVAYSDIMNFNKHLLSRGIANVDELIAVGVEFVDKFYPDKNFAYEDQIYTLAYVSNWTNYHTAGLFRERGRSSDSPEEYRYNCEMAKQFFEYIKAGSCEVVKDEQKKEECTNLLQVNFYDIAQGEIEALGGCIQK